MRTIMALAAASFLTTTAANAVAFTFSSTPTPTVKVGGAPIAYDNFTIAQGRPNFADPGASYHGCGLSTITGNVGSLFGGVPTPIYRFDNTTAAGQRLNPYGAASSKCFMSLSDPNVDQGDPTGTADFGLRGMAVADPNSNDVYSSYIGFYWGSVDDYNYIQLLNDAGDAVQIAGITDGNGNVSGTEIAKLAGIGVNTATSIYVNIFLAPTDLVTDLVLGNTQNYAFELTNLASSDAPVDGQVGGNPPAASPNFSPSLIANAVPEPGAALALGAGLGLLGLVRRKRG